MKTFILSSDSDDEGPPPPKKRPIEGVPSSFCGDKKQRFSFGVTNVGTFKTKLTRNDQDTIKEQYRLPGVIEEDSHVIQPSTSSPSHSPPRQRHTLFAKTPSSLRRRSVSLNSFSPAVEHISGPPKSNVCSMFVQNDYDFNALSSDDEEGEQKLEEDLNLRALLSPDKKSETKKKRKEKVEEVLNEFYGVYCLISRSERACYKNRCYIGYTVDPNRRIMQHNGGRDKGGAKKTDSRGPWDMVCVVHGFPNHVAALRFEWAWQNPNVSKSLKEKQLKKERKETPFAYQLRIACELMNSEAFCRFALTFRWLITTEELPFPTNCPPPKQTKVRYGKVKKEFSLVPSKREDYVERGECRICGEDIGKLWSLVRCLSPSCPSHFHSKCLAQSSLKAKGELAEHVFPLNANCPTCGHFDLWGDVIREQRRILKVSSKCLEEYKSLVVRKNLPHREISPLK